MMDTKNNRLSFSRAFFAGFNMFSTHVFFFVMTLSTIIEVAVVFPIFSSFKSLYFEFLQTGEIPPSLIVRAILLILLFGLTFVGLFVFILMSNKKYVFKIGVHTSWRSFLKVFFKFLALLIPVFIISLAQFKAVVLFVQKMSNVQLPVEQITHVCSLVFITFLFLYLAYALPLFVRRFQLPLVLCPQKVSKHFIIFFIFLGTLIVTCFMLNFMTSSISLWPGRVSMACEQDSLTLGFYCISLLIVSSIGLFRARFILYPFVVSTAVYLCAPAFGLPPFPFGWLGYTILLFTFSCFYFSLFLCSFCFGFISHLACQIALLYERGHIYFQDENEIAFHKFQDELNHPENYKSEEQPASAPEAPNIFHSNAPL